MLPPRPSFNFQTPLLRTRSTETETTPHKTKPIPNTPWQNVAPALHRPSVPSKSPCAFWGPTTSTTVSLYIHHSPVKKKNNNFHAQFFTKSQIQGIAGGLEIGICFVDGVVGQMHHDFWPWPSNAAMSCHCKSLDELGATRSIKVTVETPEVLGVKKGQWLMMMVLMGMFDTYDFGIFLACLA